jgi:NAD-dependent dihydropyrimidine dehydrogenase PreA subunit
MELANANDPWFPMIISEKCDGCIKVGNPRCVEFCPNDVFVFENGKAVVARPANCGKESSRIHCSACAPLCHSRAISFPSKNVENRQEGEDEKGLIRKVTCSECGKQYWTNRQTNVCFDCEK